MRWLEENPTCPLCKAKVESIKYHWRSPSEFEIYQVSTKTPSTASPSFIRTFRPQRPHLLPRPRPRPQPYWREERPELSLPLDPSLILRRRRDIYSRQFYSSHVGTNRISRFRDLTPQLFYRDEELVSRTRKWIRRELQVFEFLNPEGIDAASAKRRTNGAEFLLECIISILKTVDIQGPGGHAEDLVQEFLGRDNTRLFLGELKSWLRSPYHLLEDWDRQVQYNEANIEPSVEERTRYTEHANSASSHNDAGTGNQASRSTPRDRIFRRRIRYSPYQIHRLDNT